jgi:cyclase
VNVARIIPCLDVTAGRVVKGVNFVDLTDAGDPVELAARYDAEGADEIVFLDITASSDERDTIVDLARRVAEQVFIPFTIGGGIRSVDDARALLRAGADKVSLNTVLFEDAPLVDGAARRFGSQCVVASLDVRRMDDRLECFNYCGARATGVDPVTLARELADRGAGEILLTSIDRDGTMTGYDLDLVARVASAVPIPVIASGGAGTYQHLVDAVQQAGASAVAAASIFHFTEQTPAEAKAAMRAAGIPVRENFGGAAAA